MEMQEIAIEGERNEEDVGVSELKVEAKTEEEAEADPYSKLQSPAEDVYSEAFYSGPPVKPKAGEQSEGNTCLYRAGCIFLTIVCLVLLLVIILLSVKLETGSEACPVREETTAAEDRTHLSASTCNYKQCQALFPQIQLQHRSCKQCADGWLSLGRSCFFLSTYRLSWDQSQRNCSARGGSLAVISSLGVQHFLTKVGKMTYWIGLRQNGDTWNWVNNSALQESYWAGGRQQGDCGMLSSGDPPEKNWVSASCMAYTYFICQLQL